MSKSPSNCIASDRWNAFTGIVKSPWLPDARRPVLAAWSQHASPHISTSVTSWPSLVI